MKTIATALLIVLAVGLLVLQVKKARTIGDAGASVWFYDQSDKRLYAAPRDLVPPDGDTDNRVRAVVIGFQGMKNDPTHLRIAYLEKYSPPLRAILSRVAAAHRARIPFTENIPPPYSPYVTENTLVKRPGESSWHSLDTPEAREIMAAWRTWRGPEGQPPIVSSPAMP